ncbi:MAG TPA: hypothetical protein VMV49_15720 [Candidatus Deferrimicrobium sp.]|nr:hypothetical protein [Candidatus Deferrimicrobium sp.]
MSLKKFFDLSLEKQEKFIEYLMKIKNETEILIIDTIKGKNTDIFPYLNSIKKVLTQIEKLL